jgi:hypothetical protein
MCPLDLYVCNNTNHARVREQIADLKMKMEDMSQEFGEMLKETLDKMSEKIEATSNEWEQDAGGGGNVEKKLEELGVASQ